MTPFYGWGSTASRLEPLQGGSLLFTTKFPESPGTQFYRPRKDERLSRPWSHPVDLGATHSKPPYKSVNYSSNQRSPKFGSYNIKFS